MDVRQRPESISDRVVRPRIHHLPLDKTAGRSRQRWFKVLFFLMTQKNCSVLSSILFICLGSQLFGEFSVF